MSPTLRQAFEMAILHQRSYDEISRETGWTTGQVRVNVFRARRFAINQLGDWLPSS
jgi:DNA-directed RNA polymerase specialized sigma24 family protein